MSKTHKPTDPDRVIIGCLGSPYGVQGWIKVSSYTDPPENILHYRKWEILHRKEWQTVVIEASKVHDQTIVIKLPGCNDRDLAKSYTHAHIAIYRDELPLLPEAEYYWVDLMGLRVVTEDGIELGTVIQVLATGANDVIVVKGPEKKHLIPYTKEAIKSINTEDKIIVTDWDPNF